MKMKLRFLLFPCLFLLSQNVQSQIYLGPQLGLGITSGDELSSLAYNVGLTVDVPVSDLISFQSGVAWNSRTVGGPPFYEGYYWEVNNLYVPVTFKLKASLKKVDLYVNPGASIGFLVNPEYKYWDEGGTEAAPLVDFERSELALLFGGGILFKGKYSNWFLEMQKRYGLNDLTDKNDAFNLRVSSFDFFRIGVLFPISKSEN